MKPISIAITKDIIDRVAVLACQCSSQVTRERVLVSQAAALAFRQHLTERGLSPEDGRSVSPQLVDLLDICDLNVNNWSIEVRTVTRVEEPGLYVPTMPLMVGVLSDFYISAQTSAALQEVDVHGWASQEALGKADLTANGLFAVVPEEDLTPIDDLVEVLSEPKRSDHGRRRSFVEWQELASRIIRGLNDL